MPICKIKTSILFSYIKTRELISYIPLNLIYLHFGTIHSPNPPYTGIADPGPYPPILCTKKLFFDINCNLRVKFLSHINEVLAYIHHLLPQLPLLNL